MSQELLNFKKSYDELNVSCESTKSELKHSKAEILRLKKVQEDLKMSNQAKEDTAC